MTMQKTKHLPDELTAEIESLVAYLERKIRKAGNYMFASYNPEYADELGGYVEDVKQLGRQCDGLCEVLPLKTERWIKELREELDNIRFKSRN